MTNAGVIHLDDARTAARRTELQQEWMKVEGDTEPSAYRYGFWMVLNFKRVFAEWWEYGMPLIRRSV